MAFLRKEGPHLEAPTPDLVFLDLNLPGRSGQDLMREISADPELCKLPIVVLTDSSAPEDIQRMYSLRCSSYIPKPRELKRFQTLLEQVIEYWFSVVSLPTRLSH